MSKATTAPELSHDDVRRLLSTAIRSVMPRQTSIYVEDVYPDYVIYRDYDAEASYRRDYTLDANGSVTLGDAAEVMQRTVYDTVQMAAFSLDSSTDTAAGVPWKGPIFRAGDYPDKGLSISTAELDAAVGAFAPVPLNVEHKDSIFSGSFGELSKVWREGEELFGEITTPSWFKTDVVGGKRLSVSTEWDVAAKRLTGLATALNPRVTGAEVVAVFSKAEAHFVGKRNSSADATKIQSIHDNAAKLGAECGGKEKANMSQEQVQTPKPSIGDRFKAFFGLLTPEERKELGLPEQAATVTAIQPHVLEMSTATLSAGPSQREKDLEAEIARLKGDKKATIAADAAAFAAEQINAGKATPADRDAIVARFSEAAEDDVDLARRVTFSVGGETKEGTRVERLRAEFTAREGHGLLTERAGQEGVQVLMSTGTSGAPGEATTEQVHALLKLTPTGASALRLATK